jgi:hypothetical protein
MARARRVALPPRPVSPGTTRGGLATDRRAPRASDFPISKNLENHLSAQEKYIQGEEKSEKIMEVGNEIWKTFHN